MPYNVKTAEFEGPFELLLHLVSQQKVDITAISISQIADQYLDYIDKMRELDMEVASDFLLVAASLLAIKAKSLIPDESALVDEEDLEQLSPDQARDILVARLIAYKQFKNVSAWLNTRYQAEGRMHTRNAFLDEQFASLMPDFLQDTTLEELCTMCAALVGRREVFLLEAEHIAAKPVSLSERIGIISDVLKSKPEQTFKELVKQAESPAEVVVSFLAILELYHQGAVDLLQAAPTDDIDIKATSVEALENVNTDVEVEG
jgi:segregation and condensation protein A